MEKRCSQEFTKFLLGSNFFCFSLIFSRSGVMRNWQEVIGKLGFVSLFFLLFPFSDMKKETLIFVQSLYDFKFF